MLLRRSTAPRAGLTLIEVLVSLAIFLFSLVALGQLISLGSDRALDAQWLQEGSDLCQSKMAELAIGVVPLQGQANVPIPDDPGWTWSCNCTADSSLPGLWRVQVQVVRQRSYRPPLVVTLQQLLLDPSLRGSTLDPTPQMTDLQEDTGGSSSSSSSNSNSSAGAGNTNNAAPGASGKTGGTPNAGGKTGGGNGGQRGGGGNGPPGAGGQRGGGNGPPGGGQRGGGNGPPGGGQRGGGNGPPGGQRGGGGNGPPGAGGQRGGGGNGFPGGGRGNRS